MTAGWLVAAALSGCSGAGSTALPSGGQTASLATVSTEPRPGAKQQLVYVGDAGNDVVSVFDAATKQQNPPPLRTITNGIAGPFGMTTDKAGDLWVANFLGNTVTEYAPGTGTPKKTLSTGISAPIDVKVDGFGNVYVANFAASQPTIVLFPKGATTPSYTWTPGIYSISGIALLNATVQGQTSIYVTGLDQNSVGRLLTCYPGNPSCTTLNGYAFAQTGGIAIEQSPGGQQPFEFLVVDRGVPGVDTFVNTQLTNQLNTGGQPEFIALNGRRNALYVADSASGAVEKYGFPGGARTNTYTAPAFNVPPTVVGVATFPAGTFSNARASRASFV